MIDIKDDGGIKGVSIKGAIYFGQNDATSMTEINKGIEYFKQQLKDEFKKAGLKEKEIKLDITTTRIPYAGEFKTELKR